MTFEVRTPQGICVFRTIVGDNEVTRCQFEPVAPREQAPQPVAKPEPEAS